MVFVTHNRSTVACKLARRPTGNARTVVLEATGQRLFAASSQGNTP